MGQIIESPEIEPYNYRQLILTKELRKFNGEKIVFLANVQIGHPHAKQSSLHLSQKLLNFNKCK